MRYLSLFSGIEAATQAWQPLGWECVAVSEIEPFPCAVLEHHYPNVLNLGDVTKITEQQIKNLGQIDLIVFGSPCQNLSVAGNRKGFEGEQSSLFYAAMEIIKHAKRHCKTRFALWENVPGAFSSNKGADFTEVVKHMAGLDDLDTPANGWGKEGAAVGNNGLLEWSVLDAQWFGLAQRRKRVFAIVDFGEWASRPPILLERESLRRDTPPSRETRQDTTADVRASATSRGFDKQRIGQYGDNNVASTCAARDYKDATDLVVEPIAIAGNIIGRTEGNGGNGNGFDESGACYTLTTNDRHAVAYGFEPGITKRESEPSRFNQEVCPTLRANMGDNQVGVAYGPLYCGTQNDALRDLGVEICPTLRAGHGGGAVNPMIVRSVVRRLTPIECERLQGFPDNFTQIPYRNKSADQCPNGVRYKALGNSMAVNVMAWIGQRVQQATAIKVYGV